MKLSEISGLSKEWILLNPIQKFGELWNILPYAGLWGEGPCGQVTNFLIPKVRETYLVGTLRETYLVGTPYAGNNTGVNQNLKLISFVASTPEEPIAVSGPQNIFLDNNLIHTVRWQIDPISDGIKNVRTKYNDTPFGEQRVSILFV